MTFNRQQQKERRALAKSVQANLKKRAAGTGWRFRDGFLFRESSGWFFSAHTGVYVMDARIICDLSAKPMAADPLFWDIVLTPNNRDQPLSFRVFGAWTCPNLTCSSTPLTDAADAESISEAAFAWIVAQQLAESASLTLDTYIDRLAAESERHPFRRATAALVVGLILAERYLEARELCAHAIERRDTLGYSVGSHSFPELALAWLDRTKDASAIH